MSPLSKCPQTGAALLLALICGMVSMPAHSQALPATAGQTLSGKRLVLADALRGHAAIVIAGFSKDAGDPCGQWAKAVHADPALSGFLVYQAASLEQAPGFVRGMIQSAMRKGLSPDEQDHFLILTQDEKLWRSYFGVTTGKDPYIVMLDANGKILWHGHGDPKTLEPLLHSAK